MYSNLSFYCVSFILIFQDREKDYVKDTESDKKTEASKSDLLEPNPERDSDEGGSTIPLLQLVQQLLRYVFYYPLNLV